MHLRFRTPSHWLGRLALFLGACVLSVQGQAAAPAPAASAPATPREGKSAAPPRTRVTVPASARRAAEPAASPATRPNATPSAGEGERNAVKWFNMLDADGDGRISLDEAKWAFALRPSLRAEFEAADTNHDGYVTADEVRAAAQRERVAREARRARERAAQAQPQRTGDVGGSATR